MINYDVKFITCDENLVLKNTDFLSYKYETKKRSDESVFDYGKRDYLVRRGGHWRAPHPRHLKQLESRLRDEAVVKATWMTDSLISILFASGTIAYLTVKLATRDVTHILFDRYFVGKLAGPLVTNVAICKSHMLFTHSDKTATLVCFGKSCNTVPCRITDRDPSLHCIELGGAARRTERVLSSCDTPSGARILVWSVAAAEPAPWSPVSAIEDLANLHLYQIIGIMTVKRGRAWQAGWRVQYGMLIHGETPLPIFRSYPLADSYCIYRNNISLLAYHQLENETICADLSQNEDVIHIVEQTTYQKNGVIMEWVRYSIPSAARAVKLGGAGGATRAALPAPARTTRRSACDARLLVACIDGSLHVLHRAAGLTCSVKAGFIPTQVAWVEELVVASAETGRLQCYDRALAPLQHAQSLDLSAHAREGRRMQVLCSQPARGGCVMLTSFSGGPLALLRVSHPSLLTAWIRARRLAHAASLLEAMDWARAGAACLAATAALLHHALRSAPEAASLERHAQRALGAYLAPRAPHGPLAARYAPPALDLARKYFHHLLRRGRIETALQLAVDLCAWDLFADARWASEARRLPHLAREAAAARASLAAAHTGNSIETALQLAVDLCAWDLFADARWASEARRLPHLAREAAAARASLAAAHTGNSIETALQLAVDLCAWDLFADARWASEARRLPHLAREAAAARASLAAAHTGNSIETALQLAVDLCAWDLFADARWASEARRLPHLAHEAAAARASLAAAHTDSECSESCSSCGSSASGDDASGSDVTRAPPPARRPAPRPHPDRDTTIWNSEVKVLRNCEVKSHDLKPILSTQSSKWLENGLPSSRLDVVPRRHGASFKHVFQTELREEPRTLYRYQDCQTTTDRNYRNDGVERHGKNKVKFSDTVTIAVVAGPAPEQELADSLPLGAPHNYLAAFAPLAPHAPHAPGTVRDYVEV